MRGKHFGRGLALAALLTTATAPSAFAAGATLKRAVWNVTQAPLDMVLAPVTSEISYWRYVGAAEGTGSTIARVAITQLLPLQRFICQTISILVPTIRLVEGIVMLPVGAATVMSDEAITFYEPPRSGKGKDAIIDSGWFYIGPYSCKGVYE